MYQEITANILKKSGIKKPTLIQEKTYLPIKSGENILALAKTGTGKTLAYSLPALENTEKNKANSLVIIAPTTELVVQIRQVIAPYASALKLSVLSLAGAGNRNRQEDKLKKGHPEVLVATPGRFFDFYSANRIKVSQIKTLVIDEADDVLEFSKLELLSSLGQNMQFDSQILLFGATTSSISENAEEIFGRHFELIDVREQQVSSTENYFLKVDNSHKTNFVQRLDQLDHFKGLLFFDSNQSLLRFAGILGHTKTHFTVLANEFSKQKKSKALQDFKQGRVNLLLATDIAARGLDIPEVNYVINFDIPSEKNTYLHRAGRCGRMGAHGYVVSLGDDHDLRNLKKLLVDIPLTRVYFAGYKLVETRPKKKQNKNHKLVPETSPLKARKKHGKHKNKNKGYHPHHLKRKK